jgi:hypothetical protein
MNPGASTSSYRVAHEQLGADVDPGIAPAAAYAIDRVTSNHDHELVGALPREVGILLIAAGVGGILLPGPIGSPFLLLGTVTLSPRLFSKLEARFRKRFPRMHQRGTRQIKRFLADLERRYPDRP